MQRLLKVFSGNIVTSRFKLSYVNNMYPCSAGEIGCLPALAGKEQDLSFFSQPRQIVQSLTQTHIVEGEEGIV